MAYSKLATWAIRLEYQVSSSRFIGPFQRVAYTTVFWVVLDPHVFNWSYTLPPASI